MNKPSFHKTPLATGVALALGATVASPVMAQEGADEDVIEEVVTTGIRSSLMTSMNRKRTATGVVDAITSEEIGKFPDQNLAEALARITGVSIQRINNEGSQITVRGMGPEFNLVTLNGRSMPTQGSRSFDFGDIATEGIRAVEVYKSGRVDIPTGGIGATVNIETARPLDNPGFRSVVSAKAVHETTSSDSTIGGLSEFTPELAALVSSTFADDTIGVLVSASYQDRDNREEYADVAEWIPNYAAAFNGGIVNDNNQREDDLFWHPQDIQYGFAEISRERINGQLVLQWAPTDRITTTLDYTYSEVDFEKDTHFFGLWFESPNVESTINERGTVTEVAMAGGDYAIHVVRDHTIKENDSLGLNLDWQVNDTLSLNLDVHDSSSTLRGAGLGDGVPGSKTDLIIGNTFCNWCGFVPGAGPFTANIGTKSAVYPASGIPLWNVDFVSTETGEPVDVAAQDIGMLFAQSFDVDNTNDITQLQLGGTWDNDGGGAITGIDFGVGYTDQEFVNRNAFSGLLPAGFWNDSASQVPDGEVRQASFAGLLGDFSNGGNFAYDSYSIADFGSIVNWYETANSVDQGLRDCCYWQAVPGGAFWGPDFVSADGSRGFINPGPMGNASGAGIEEEILAAYVQVNFDDELNGMPFSGSFGVRYEDTETTSTGDEVPVTAVIWSGGDEFASEFGDPTFVTRKGSNKQWLPSINMNLEVIEDVITRFSYSRTLARPDIGALSPVRTFVGNPNIGRRSATAGNPDLVPYLSDNLDLSVEWYYGEGSYASVTHFRKRVDNFIVSTTTQEDFADEGGALPDPFEGAQAELARQQLADEGIPTSNQNVFARINENIGAPIGSPIRAEPGDPNVVWDVTTDTNARVGNLWGWEFQVQHMWDMGFGIQANLTTVSGDVDADRNVIGEQFALPGLSDSANVVAFYENDWMSARVAWNWRDEYLLTFDANDAPVFFEEYQQVDLNFTWYAMERLDVFFEALNITDETIRQYVRYPQQFDFGAQYGARYNIGARYTFD
ncbi:MAG: TonB-dependent receptor [Gammaproteobacteria bacterium]|jgi:TonB-dependent receptor|nr:TonB-dependent receptor [Gammaproteobacteria bacterium]HSG96874.1 TonB-dependent receptor [Woeseiaceae bacterium]